MTKEEKVKNIFAFLSILFVEKRDCLINILDMTPDYIIEKFERYVISTSPGSSWGLHPSLRKSVFNKYCEKYGLPIEEEC